MILWYHYAMSGLQSLKKDRCLPQDPRGSRLRVGPTQSTCLLVGALIVGASGAMGDDISNQSQLDAAISAGSNKINITAGNLALSGSQSIAPTADLTVATGASLSLSNANQTVGSLSGGGTITLGTTFLTAGGNNNSTAFSGTLQMTKQGYDPPPLRKVRQDWNGHSHRRQCKHWSGRGLHLPRRDGADKWKHLSHVFGSGRG